MEEIKQFLNECKIDYTYKRNEIYITKPNFTISEYDPCKFIIYDDYIYLTSAMPFTETMLFLCKRLFCLELIEFIKSKGYNDIYYYHDDVVIRLNEERYTNMTITIPRFGSRTNNLDSREMMHMTLLLAEIEKFAENNILCNKIYELEIECREN